MTLTNVIKYLTAYFFISIIVSICKSEVLIYFISSNYKNILRISSITSIFIFNIIISFFLFFIFFLTWTIKPFFKIETNLNIYIDSLKYLIYIQIIGEILKFSLIWIFLVDEVKYLKLNASNFQQQLSSTTFYILSNISNKIFFLASIVMFYFNHKHLSENFKNSIKITILLSLFISILLFL